MSKKTAPVAIRAMVRTIRPPRSVAAVRAAIGRRPGGVMLESVAHDPAWGRFSIYGVDCVRTETVSDDGREDPFARLAAVCRPWSPVGASGDWPFPGGWVGYLAYDAGSWVEPTAGRRDEPGPLPVSQWRLFDTVLLHDVLADRWAAAAVDLPETITGSARPTAEARLSAIERWIEAIDDDDYGSRSDNDNAVVHAGRWDDSTDAYLDNVEWARRYIAAGDVFQVNLARHYRAAVHGAPIRMYQRLCETNPATHAAYLDVTTACGGRAAILSSSPELFLHVRGRDVLTRPIKGTRPRRGDPMLDSAAAAELDRSDKDRAELNMIIDLERNDLGRVCEYGSVQVLDDGAIEELPTVYHRTATIAGRLRDDADGLDLLRAAFPGGSITGAPKVRAMQIIRELEPSPRGPYCGAIGYIGLSGDVHLNLAIRTMVVADGVADLAVGSGIVADSDPAAELAELNAKAAGMMAALAPVGASEAASAELSAVGA